MNLKNAISPQKDQKYFCDENAHEKKSDKLDDKQNQFLQLKILGYEPCLENIDNYSEALQHCPMYAEYNRWQHILLDFYELHIKKSIVPLRSFEGKFQQNTHATKINN